MYHYISNLSVFHFQKWLPDEMYHWIFVKSDSYKLQSVSKQVETLLALSGRLSPLISALSNNFERRRRERNLSNQFTLTSSSRFLTKSEIYAIVPQEFWNLFKHGIFFHDTFLATEQHATNGVGEGVRGLILAARVPMGLYFVADYKPHVCHFLARSECIMGPLFKNNNAIAI